MKPIPAPRLPARNGADDWPYGAIEKGEGYKDLNLVDVEWDHAENASFASVRIVRADMGHVGLRGISLDDALVSDSNLSNADWSEATARRLVLEDCRLAGLRLNDAKLQQTVFRRCQGTYVQAPGAVFKEARFEGCALIEGNFDGADLRGVAFDDCDLGGTTFAGAKLEGADFTTSRLEASRVRLADLKGAILAPHQAIALLERETGAVVRLD